MKFLRPDITKSTELLHPSIRLPYKPTRLLRKLQLSLGTQRRLALGPLWTPKSTGAQALI